MFNYAAIPKSLGENKIISSSPAAVAAGTSYAWAAAEWTDFISSFARTVTPPVLPPVEWAGRTALYGILYSGLLTPGGFTSALRIGLYTYAGFLALGMLPAFVGIPPLIPVFPEPAIAMGMSSPFVPGYQVMLAHYTAIALFFQAGFAVSTVPPFPVVKWI